MPFRGDGGDALVSDTTSLSRLTIRKGRRELESIDGGHLAGVPAAVGVRLAVRHREALRMSAIAVALTDLLQARSQSRPAHREPPGSVVPAIESHEQGREQQEIDDDSQHDHVRDH